MFRVYFFFVLMACVCLLTEAQLTFTSSWGGGKRSMAPMPCRNDEGISTIYRMIQHEAERVLLCQKN